MSLPECDRLAHMGQISPRYERSTALFKSAWLSQDELQPASPFATNFCQPGQALFRFDTRTIEQLCAQGFTDHSVAAAVKSTRNARTL